jgi:hypothetical protein
MNPGNRLVYRSASLNHALAHCDANGIDVPPQVSEMLEQWAAGDDDRRDECEAWFTALSRNRHPETGAF